MAALPRCLFVLSLIAAPLAAQAPEQGPAPRHVDRYGDPLPAGAIQRFGSLRLRHPQLVDFTILPDGKTAVSVGRDNTVRWWDLGTGKQTGERRLGDTPLAKPTLSADGATVVGFRKKLCVVADAVTGRVTGSFPVEKIGTVEGVAVSADGARVAVGGDGCRIVLYDCRTKQVVAVALAFEQQDRTDSQPDLHAAFSPDGSRLAVGAINRGKLVVLDAATGRELFSRACFTRAAAFTPAGDRLAIVEYPEDWRFGPRTPRLIDLKTGVAWSVDATASEGSPRVAVSPDGGRVLVTEYGASRLLDAATGKDLCRLPPAGPGRFSPDGARVVLGLRSRLLVRETATGRPVNEEDPEPEFFTPEISPDGRTVAAPDRLAGTVDLWDTRTGRVRLSLAGLGSDGESIAFADAGRTVRACNSRGDIRSWDAATGRPQGRHFSADPDTRIAWQFTADGAGAHARGISGDGDADRIEVRDAATGRVVRRDFVERAGPHRFNGWLPDGDAYIGTTSGDFALTDGKTGAARIRCDGLFKAMSRDGRWLASSRRLPNTEVIAVRIWEAASGAAVTADVAGKTPMASPLVCVHGRTAAVADGRCLRIVDLATGKDRGRWEFPRLGHGHFADHPATGLALFPDGRTAFTPIIDGTALTWDISSFPVEQLSPTHTEADLTNWWADLAGDAKPAYAAIWKLAETPPDALLPFLRQRLRPVITPTAAEWGQLMAALDSPEFRVRVAALRRVEQFGDGALDDLNRELRHTASAEARERLGQLAATMAGPIPSAGTLRFLRALAVLEEVKTVDARRLVEELSHGVATAKETTAAVMTLGRMRDVESWRR